MSKIISRAGQFTGVCRKYEKMTRKYHDIVPAFFNEPEP